MVINEFSDASDSVSRRNLLKTAGLMGATAMLADPAGANAYVDSDAEPAADEDPVETYELLAVKDAWVGRAPDRIQGR